MINVLLGLCLFAGICVLTTLSIDIGILAYHRATGTVTAEKVMEKIAKAKDETIMSQKKTILTQQEALRYDREQLLKLREQLQKYEEEGDAET